MIDGNSVRVVICSYFVLDVFIFSFISAASDFATDLKCEFTLETV